MSAESHTNDGYTQLYKTLSTSTICIFSPSFCTKIYFYVNHHESLVCIENAMYGISISKLFIELHNVC